MTGSKTFGEAWSRSVSPESSWIVQTVVTIAPIVSCIANTIVLSDVLKLVLRVAGTPAWLYTNRNLVLTLLTSAVLYPICRIQNLSALKSVSVIGLAGQFTAMLAMAIRLLDGSYRPVVGKYFASSLISAAVSVTKVESTAAASTKALASSSPALSKWFILASLLSYCFVTHYNVSE